MKATTRDAYQLLLDGAIALAQIEHNGVRVDEARLDRTIRRVEADIKKMEAGLQKDKVWQVWVDVYGRKANLGSREQLGEILYTHLEYPCLYRTKPTPRYPDGRPSTREEHLKDIDHPFVAGLFAVEHLKKTAATFLKGIKRETVNGFLHPFFHLHTVVTFRSSSAQPNFQNLPRRDEFMAKLVRRCFVPREDRHFWEIDFKGAEVAVAACVCLDPVLISYVKDTTKDMHRDMAAECFLLEIDQVTKRARDLAKNQFVFPAFYGSYYAQTAANLWDFVCRDKELVIMKAEGDGGEPGAQKELEKQMAPVPLLDHLARKGIKELGACDPKQPPRPGTFEHHIKGVEDRFWGERFRVYAQWKRDWWAAYQRDGYFITPTGFRVTYGKGGLLRRNEAINSPIQGSAFHCLLWTIIRLQKWLTKNKMKTRLTGQIHDSLVGDSPPDEIQSVLSKVKQIIEEELPRHWSWIVVPLSVECAVAPVDESWYEKEEWLLQAGRWRRKGDA